MAYEKDFDCETRCPYCGYRCTRAASPNGDRPAPGDISMCIGCGHMGIFDPEADGGVRRTTAQEAAEIAMDAQAMRVLQAHRSMVAHFGRRE